ncbi:DnaJ-domain-containing protein [Meredithblackwellia eburnea MCA 4105]
MAEATEDKPANIGPDGEKIIDMTFYELLGVRGDADQATLKKAYRKAALINHPDRNPGDESAAAKFQAIGEAYGVLSDPQLRAVYNKQGALSAVSGGPDGTNEMPDPGQLFSQLFGGAAFVDWIGEISLGKDVSKAFEMGTTEEERDRMRDEFKTSGAAAGGVPGGGAGSGAATPTIEATKKNDEHKDDKPTTTTPPPPTGAAPPTTTTTSSPTLSPSSTSSPPDPTSTPTPTPLSPAEQKALLVEERRLASEKRALERAKLEEYDRERQAEKRERVRVLSQKLVERIRSFVEARNPGEGDDPETRKYAERIREEGRDLAMESFGVEICWLIGEVYMTKASQYIKLHRKPSSNILGIPAWGSRVKEKFTMLKEGWSFLSVGLDIQSSMADLEKRQAKGEVDEEEMKNLEQDLSGKLLLVAWKGSKFELSGILRQVVDTVLAKDQPGVTDAILMNRAKAILMTGAILKAIQPDESDAERRELERMVAEANQKRKEKGKGTKKK